ncbi:type III-A CRISPR-associated protein Csm2 [Eubacterium ramulus]|uniref:CRISPR system Cms protein Csm2 n=1 Tax=Eubacterium ramulus TaxID=39490 RepID=A0A173V8V1_EUBRA|nr:type III-A CRISPR-associated protein Csm2 [Eubacterium ramulus]CUN22575.1 CRISPR type III-A/MTUBE-associated protein Csm2 [Eubacterium ramulus]
MKLTEDNYTELAEKVIVKLSQEKRPNGKPVQMVTTSKIRNLLAMTADIYNDVINSQDEKLSTDIAGRIKYMKIRFVYEAGRQAEVKKLVEQAGLLEHLDDIGNSRKQYILFSRYMEALVAYRKFYGGKDD